MSLLLEINRVAWVLGNLASLYTAVATLIFVITYYVLFDPRATTAGRLVFRFFMSLLGLLVLVTIGIYVDTPVDRSWWVMSETIATWRPIFRLAVYTYTSYAVTSLAVFLVIRKWWPHKLRTAEGTQDEFVVPRNPTTEIPITKQ